MKFVKLFQKRLRCTKTNFWWIIRLLQPSCQPLSQVKCVWNKCFDCWLGSNEADEEYSLAFELETSRDEILEQLLHTFVLKVWFYGLLSMPRQLKMLQVWQPWRAATDNAKRSSADLTIQYNRARRAAITRNYRNHVGANCLRIKGFASLVLKMNLYFQWKSKRAKPRKLAAGAYLRYGKATLTWFEGDFREKCGTWVN